MHSFPKKILISGQTHGNEWTGRYVAKQLGKIDLKAAYPNLEIKIILSNPKAFELNQRYVDQDLNRSFGEHQGLTNYEIIRAKEIKEQLKSFAQGDEVFIIDLHTTTSSMGSSLVLHNTLPENITVFSYLKKIMRIEHDESIHAYAWLEKKELNFLNSLSQFGFAIELGPVAQGTLCPNTYKKTMDLLLTTLKFLNKSYEALSNVNAEEEIHVHKKSIDYPRDEGGDLSDATPSNVGNELQKLKK